MEMDCLKFEDEKDPKVVSLKDDDKKGTRTFTKIKPVYIKLLSEKFGNRWLSDQMGVTTGAISDWIRSDITPHQNEKMAQLIWEIEVEQKSEMRYALVHIHRSRLPLLSKAIMDVGGKISIMED